jgi:hypothetical protein
MMKFFRFMTWLVLILALLLAGPAFMFVSGRTKLNRSWQTATHHSAGLAPKPLEHREAVAQVYAGRAFGWRGAFSDHTWVAVKPAGASRYTRYEVIGWYAGNGRSVIAIGDQRAPDAQWYGAEPRLIQDIRGAQAEAVIARLPKAAASYPYPATYRAWPGPNSNTFIAHLAREIPELELAMPSTAVGKDYVPWFDSVGASPSHTGVRISLYGLAGVIVGLDEGIEINLLGLVTGVDVRRPALKLPGIGRVPGDG